MMIYSTNEVADAVIGFGRFHDEVGTSAAFARHGLDAEEVLGVVTHTHAERMTHHQAMALGIAVGVALTRGTNSIDGRQVDAADPA